MKFYLLTIIFEVLYVLNFVLIRTCVLELDTA